MTINPKFPMPQDIPELPDQPVDWLDFYDEATEKYWKIHLNWVTSNWSCMFAAGCPGCISAEENETQSALGCCVNGVHFESDEDYAKTEALVQELTEEDLDADQLAYIQKNGWAVKFMKADGTFSAKTKVKDKGCVFNRRGQGVEGKTGCAFHHLGERTGRSHVELMPQTCWQLPIGHRKDVVDGLGNEFDVILPWDKEYFDCVDGDPQDDADMLFWCVNTPDAYQGTHMLFQSLWEEFIAIMGKPAYDRMTELIMERKQNYIAKMPGAVRNEGRPMIPLLIADRPPRPAKFNAN